jgi:hypothetical protein
MSDWLERELTEEEQRRANASEAAERARRALAPSMPRVSRAQRRNATRRSGAERRARIQGRRIERELNQALAENSGSNSGSNSRSNGEALLREARARAQARVREQAAARVRGQYQERWVPPQNEMLLYQPRQRIVVEDAPDLGTLYLDLSDKVNSMSLDKFRIGRAYARVQHGRHAFYYGIDSLQRWLDTGNHTNPDTREPITADGITLFTYGGPVKTSSHGPIQGGTLKKLKRKHAKGTRHKRK